MIRRDERGQALAETALLSPILALLLVGLIDVGHLAQFSVRVHTAAHAGVEYGAQSLTTAPDSTGMQNAASNDAAISGMTATGSYSCTCADGSNSTCQATDCSSSHRITYVTVTTSAPYSTLIHWPGMTSSFTVTGSATMRVRQ
ncbi:MAG: pilus assembly protein [Candidatus Eremiobacteraeota bacterium]|nr:pilus assembly protein [Candidatus Eremiobacteraeota bacterium]